MIHIPNIDVVLVTIIIIYLLLVSLSLKFATMRDTLYKAAQLRFSPRPCYERERERGSLSVGRGPIRGAAPSVRRCYGPQRSPSMGRGAAGPGWDVERPRGPRSATSSSASENYKRVLCAESARTRHTDSTVYFYSGHHGAGQLVNRHSRIDALCRSLLSFAPAVPAASFTLRSRGRPSPSLVLSFSLI